MFKVVNSKVMLTDLPYRFLKKLAQVYLPAAGTLYFGLAAIWSLPAAEQVSGTVLAVDTFLGVCLGLSAKNYDDSGAAHDGEMVVGTNPDTGKTVYSLDLKDQVGLEDIPNKDSISFKVVSKDSQENIATDSVLPPRPPS